MARKRLFNDTVSGPSGKYSYTMRKSLKLYQVLSREIRTLHTRIPRFCCREVLVLGDSHADVFNHFIFFLRFPFLFFNAKIVQGATASGLENPHSKTQAYQEFSAVLKKYNGKKVILLLGEVDTGFVIWYRAKKYGENVSKMAKLTQDVYKHFIDEIHKKFDLIVISSPLPTIKDGAAWGAVANARKEVTATQQERTRLTVEFNRSIQGHCEYRNIHYINLDQESLGENGLVRVTLMNKDPLNHHYNQTVYAKMLAERLSAILTK